MKKKIPTFKSDREAERFVDTADLSDYDLSGVKPVRFEFEKKSARADLRLPRSRLDALEEARKAARNPLPAVYPRGSGTGRDGAQVTPWARAASAFKQVPAELAHHRIAQSLASRCIRLEVSQRRPPRP